MTVPANLPSQVGAPSGAPQDVLSISLYLAQFVQALNAWIAKAATAVNWLLSVPGTFITASVPSASVSLTTFSAFNNITKIELTAGDWDVWGNVYLTFSAGAAFMNAGISLSATSYTQPQTWGANLQYAASAGSFSMALPPQRFVVTQPIAIFLNAQASFSGTGTAGGFLSARRWR